MRCGCERGRQKGRLTRFSVWFPWFGEGDTYVRGRTAAVELNVGRYSVVPNLGQEASSHNLRIGSSYWVRSTYVRHHLESSRRPVGTAADDLVSLVTPSNESASD